MRYNKATQHNLKEIPDIKTFEELIEQLTISEEDKLLMRLHYIEDKNFAYIADVLGYSESWVKRKHLRILKKLDKIL